MELARGSPVEGIEDLENVESDEAAIPEVGRDHVPIYFHVDKLASCNHGDTIQLQGPDAPWPELQDHLSSQFSSGLSAHGRTWLLDPNSEPLTRHRELVFEFVRQAAFADRPSRFRSVFAFETIDDAKSFQNFYAIPGTPIWEVTATESFRANMMLLDIRWSGLATSAAAHAYWAGDRGDAPELWEILLRPPVHIGQRAS